MGFPVEFTLFVERNGSTRIMMEEIAGNPPPDITTCKIAHGIIIVQMEPRS